MSEQFHRRSIRLKGYDYAQAGAYFVTVCAHERAHLFGEIVNAAMEPNAMGAVVQRCWDAIPEHMPMVELDEFTMMPNHMHGIIVITDHIRSSDGRGRGGEFAALTDPAEPTIPPDNADAPRRPPIAIMIKNSLGHIVQTFKSAVSRQAVRDGLIEPGTPIWQRGYYENIIRDTADYDRIAQYIAENPGNWASDDMNR